LHHKKAQRFSHKKAQKAQKAQKEIRSVKFDFLPFSDSCLCFFVALPWAFLWLVFAAGEG
jgi:hypothetical protein